MGVKFPPWEVEDFVINFCSIIDFFFIKRNQTRPDQILCPPWNGKSDGRPLATGNETLS